MYGRPIEMDFRFDRPAFDKLYLQGKLNIAKADTVKVSMKAEGDNDDGTFFQKPGGWGGLGNKDILDKGGSQNKFEMEISRGTGNFQKTRTLGSLL